MKQWDENGVKTEKMDSGFSIDISAIINAKMAEIKDSQAIEKVIAKNFEETVLKAAETAINSYALRRFIQDAITEQVNEIASKLDFTSYNTFMMEKFTEIIDVVCKNDIKEKITSRFEDIFICKPNKKIYLSDVFAVYGEYINSNTDNDDKLDNPNGWYCKCEKDTRYGWINCAMNSDKTGYNKGYSFTVHLENEKENDEVDGLIHNLRLDGDLLEDSTKLPTYISDFDKYILQLFLNNIKICVDIDVEDDIDNSWVMDDEE